MQPNSTQSENTPARHTTISIYLLMCVPFVIYIGLTAHFGLNIPTKDDYDCILSHVVTDSRSVSRLFIQYNEHRIAWTKLVADVYHDTTGSLNFKNLIYLGNLGWLVTFLMLLKISRERKIPLILFAPVAFLCFQTQAWENVTWALGGLVNFYSLLFALVTLYFWGKRTPWGYALGLAFAAIETYAGANGILVFAVMLAWEAMNLIEANGFAGLHPKHVLKRENAHLFALVAWTAVIAFSFFYGYQRTTHHPSMVKTLMQPMLLLHYMLNLLGSNLEFVGKYAVLLAGATSIALFLNLTRLRYWRTHPTFYYMLLFVHMSVFAAGLGRAGFGADQGLASRYKMLGLMSFLLPYLAFVEAYQHAFARKWLVALTLLLAFSFNALSIRASLPGLRWKRDHLVKGMAEWQRTGTGLDHDRSEWASELLSRATREGSYDPPDVSGYGGRVTPKDQQ